MPGMQRFFVSGLVNIENTVRIDRFPLEYFPVTYPFHGVHASVSGVGTNVAKALHKLGAQVDFASIIGTDGLGDWALADLEKHGLDTRLVRRDLPETAQSVILYDGSGRRQIHVDLKALQETAYPAAACQQALAAADWVVACNINFSRALLKLARAAGKPIATDVHTLASPNDEYNRDFMRHADVLFLSHEQLWTAPDLAALELAAACPQAKVIVIGMGAEGALLCECKTRTIQPISIPPAIRPVVNTIGAGDALFSAFVWSYAQTGQADESLRRAMIFAAYKIGEKGAAEGFLDASGLAGWCQKLGVPPL